MKWGKAYPKETKKRKYRVREKVARKCRPSSSKALKPEGDRAAGRKQQGKQDVGEMIAEEGTLAAQRSLGPSGSARKLCTRTKDEMKA